MKNKSRLRRKKRGQKVRRASTTNRKTKKTSTNILVKLVEKKDEIGEKMKKNPIGASIIIFLFLTGIASVFYFYKDIFTGGLEPDVTKIKEDVFQLDSTYSEDKEKFEKNFSELDYETLRRYEEVKKELEELSYSQSQLEQNWAEMLKQLYEKRSVDEILKNSQKSKYHYSIKFTWYF